MHKNDKIKIGIIVTAIVIVSIVGFLIIGSMGVSATSYGSSWQNYDWETVKCTVTEHNQKLLYSEICIYNEEYHVEKRFRFCGKDAEDYADVQEGDVISCRMYSWFNEETGDVIDRTLYLFYQE